MLRHGSRLWHLWAFGAATAPLGLWLWHGQSRHFGFRGGRVSRGATWASVAVAAALLALGFAVGGD